VTSLTRLCRRTRPSGRWLLTADGERVLARHDRAESGPGSPAGSPPGSPAGRDLAFVVAHGFTLHHRRTDVRTLVGVLRDRGGVVSFDFRGHGSSSGLSTVGDRETADLEAAVAWARLLGYRRVVTVGWSMGASVAVRHAAEHRDVDAVVAVSGPSRWHYRGTVPMRLLHRGVETAAGRLVLALWFGTRVAVDGWDPPPEPPDAAVGRIAPVPLLVVHGDADRYFPVEHGRWLARAAGPTATFWEEPGFGHAETAAGPDLVARIAAWADRASASARMPA
jgi:pimeloyl-ACP methyl ester carboxylesterase